MPTATSRNNSQIEALNGGFEDAPLSQYQPSAEIIDLTNSSIKDLYHGDLLLARLFREFNNKTLLQRASLDQQDWLAWSPEPSENPDEAWMFTGTSNVTRNNIISMAAHVAQRIVFPSCVATNLDNEDDVAASYVAAGLLENNFRTHDFSETFVYAIISGMVNPVTYYKADYVQAHMSILEGTNSNYTRRRVLDDAMSGFQHHLLPVEEVLISNPYCFDLEKQKCLIHRRRISYAEAKEMFGDHPNWEHVQPGVLPQYNASDAMFYNMRDPVLDGMVEISTYMYRTIDLEFSTVNRIYMGNENVEYNPFTHRTNRNKPEYPIAKFGAEPIDAKRFWAYKSIAAKLSNDKELVDRMRQNAVDASTLSTYPPIVTSGAGKLGQEIVKPATVTDISKDAKVTALKNNDPTPVMKMAEMAKGDIEEGANPSYFQMPTGTGRMSQFQMMLLQQNAMANLTIIGIMIGTMITHIGRIVLHDALRYQTVAEIGELVNGLPTLTYKTFNIPRVKGGKSYSEKFIFTDVWAGKEMTEEDKIEYQIGLLDKHGDDQHVWEINPGAFVNLDFLVRVEPDQMLPEDKATLAKAKSDLYDKAIANPLIAQNPKSLADVTRDFLFEPVVHGEATKYIPASTQKVAATVMPGMNPQMPGPQPAPGQPAQPQPGQKPGMSTAVASNMPPTTV